MKILIASISILLLSLISSSTENTLILSNQKDTGRLGCISCDENNSPRVAAKCVAPGNDTSIELQDDAKVGYTLCVGTYNNVSTSDYDQMTFLVYYSKDDFEKFKNKIFIKVNATSFYRSNEEKKVWERIFPLPYM